METMTVFDAVNISNENIDSILTVIGWLAASQMD